MEWRRWSGLLGGVVLLVGCGTSSDDSATSPTSTVTATGQASVTAMSAKSSSGDGESQTLTEPLAPTSQLTSAASSTTPSSPVGAPADVVTDLDAPWSVAFVGNTPLISERDAARVVEVVGSQVRDVGTVAGVVPDGEGGLLGLATLADGGTTYLYAYFTAADDNRIVRYALTGGPGTFGLGAVETIFEGIPKAWNHNGGRIAFGPDGMLYATAGDAAVPANAQDPNSLSGKILRLTPTGAVPADNPVAGNPMYSMGHRNPQGISWDEQGTLWAAEFGQNTWDELNIIEPGANYGWPIVEGIAGDSRYVDPVQQWAPSEASPSGIVVVGGTVFIANLRGQRLTAMSIAEPSQVSSLYVGEFGRLRSVQRAPDGSLWILTNNTDGRGDPQAGDDRVLRVELG